MATIGRNDRYKNAAAQLRSLADLRESRQTPSPASTARAYYELPPKNTESWKKLVERVCAVVRKGPDRAFPMPSADGFAEYIYAKCGPIITDEMILALYPEAKKLAQQQYLKSLPIMKGILY